MPVVLEASSCAFAFVCRQYWKSRNSRSTEEKKGKMGKQGNGETENGKRERRETETERGRGEKVRPRDDILSLSNQRAF